MVLHQSRADVALLSIHYDGRVVPGERVRAFKSEGQKAKPFLDANLSKLGETIDSCAATTNSIVSQRSAMGISMWGKTFAALVEEMAAHLRSTLGIR